MTKVKVTSTPPKANIYQAINGQKKLLGKTPLLLTNVEAEEIGHGLQLLQIQIEKDGYIPENFSVQLGRGQEVKINSTLKSVVDWKDNESPAGAKVLDYFSRELQAANNLIQAKKFPEAHSKLNTLISQYQEVSILYDLQGSLFLLQGQKNQAIKSYEKSLSINPLNLTTRDFLQELKNQ